MVERAPFALRAYRTLSGAASPLASQIIAYRLRHGKEQPERIAERRGIAGLARPEGPLFWLHGASVGEILAAAALIEEVRARGFAVLVTSGTVTSAAVVRQRLPADVMHQFIPYDAPRFVRRFLEHWQPDLGVFMESDLWPNLILTAAEQRVPLILANARVSARSFARWRRAPATIGALLSTFDVCLAQSAQDAERLAALGSARIVMTGNLKLDAAPPPADPDRLAALRAAIGDRPVFVAASTHPGEEDYIVEAHRRLRSTFSGLLTVIAPRHPQRGEAIASLASGAGAATALRSRGQLPEAATDVYVADTLGELGLLYRIAPAVFMGGSLVRHGGQNPIEAAKLGAAIMHGPHVSNFAEIYAALDAAKGAEEIAEPGRLAVRIGAWLSDAAQRQAVAEAGRRVVDSLGGALERTVAMLEPYLLQASLERGRLNA